ncbi:MAG TPA: carboxymuconolactone decarboxylase family protein [Thermohalobaculum sp.]|nr:carboxymuconolactone decarboxylase family protein [Thermohalobaculum sp.]
MNWTNFLAETNRELAALRKEMPEAAAGFGQLAKAATAAGALDPKTKELMAMAIGIATHCDACIGFHAKAAVRLGATRAEIAETVAMCVYMGGGPSLMYGAKALAAFDELSAAG